MESPIYRYSPSAGNQPLSAQAARCCTTSRADTMSGSLVFREDRWAVRELCMYWYLPGCEKHKPNMDPTHIGDIGMVKKKHVFFMFKNRNTANKHIETETLSTNTS